MAYLRQSGLVVDKDRNVTVVPKGQEDGERIGMIRWDDGRFWFIAVPKTLDGKLGLIGLDVVLLEKLTRMLKTMAETPSDSEIDTLFNGNKV